MKKRLFCLCFWVMTFKFPVLIYIIILLSNLNTFLSTFFIKYNYQLTEENVYWLSFYFIAATIKIKNLLQYNFLY